MSTLMTASNQWASRPSDERFISLPAMAAHFQHVRHHSRALVTSSRRLEVRPDSNNKGLALYGSNGVGYEPTHWSFGQLSALAKAPAGYLRTLPSPMAADCLNYGFKVARDIEDVGLLLSKVDRPEVRAATGPNYGRVWNEDVTRSLIDKFGDGINGEWAVPGEFGKKVFIDKRNTTLYASDRDMFVFLANEANRIDVAGRTLARGFFVWNSEVGASTFGLACFLFDYVCCNRMIWGAQDYAELRIRHTASAPDKFIGEVTPALNRYAQSGTKTLVQAIEDARADKLDDVDKFLATRYGPKSVEAIKAVHQLEENRPIETRWDVVVAVSAKAKSIEHQDARVDLERSAGSLLNN